MAGLTKVDGVKQPRLHNNHFRALCLAAGSHRFMVGKEHQFPVAVDAGGDYFFRIDPPPGLLRSPMITPLTPEAGTLEIKYLDREW